jgi:hypothetical protein
MIFPDFLINLFQTSQLSMTMPSCDFKTLSDDQLSHMNCQVLSTRLSSSDRDANGRSVCLRVFPAYPWCASRLTQNDDRMSLQRLLVRDLLKVNYSAWVSRPAPTPKGDTIAAPGLRLEHFQRGQTKAPPSQICLQRGRHSLSVASRRKSNFREH